MHINWGVSSPGAFSVVDPRGVISGVCTSTRGFISGGYSLGVNLQGVFSTHHIIWGHTGCPTPIVSSTGERFESDPHVIIVIIIIFISRNKGTSPLNWLPSQTVICIISLLRRPFMMGCGTKIYRKVPKIKLPKTNPNPNLKSYPNPKPLTINRIKPVRVRVDVRKYVYSNIVNNSALRYYYK